MDTKSCSKCKLEKPISEFFKIKKGPGGLGSYCKLCHRATQSKEAKYAARLRYRARHIDSEKVREQAYYESNKEQINQRTLAYYHQNKEQRLAKMSEYRKSPRGLAKNRLAALKRLRDIDIATPKWANKKSIEQIYEQATLLQQDGIPREVDHIIPLHSKRVCGLHVESNLQILTKKENSDKRCKFNEEWIRASK